MRDLGFHNGPYKYYCLMGYNAV